MLVLSLLSPGGREKQRGPGAGERPSCQSGEAPLGELRAEPGGQQPCLVALGSHGSGTAGLAVLATAARLEPGAEGPVLRGGRGGQAREGRGETRERARQGESRRSSRLLNPFCFDFPPSHTAARVQTDAVISILMHFRGPCPNCSENQKSRVYLQLSL